MSKDELRDLTITNKRAGEIERIGSGLAAMMRQSNRPAAASLAQDLATEIASVRRDLGRLATHVLNRPTIQPSETDQD